MANYPMVGQKRTFIATVAMSANSQALPTVSIVSAETGVDAAAAKNTAMAAMPAQEPRRCDTIIPLPRIG